MAEFICHEDSGGRIHLTVPTIEIVRCRDCAKWHYFDYRDGVRYGECDEWRRPDSYCVPATREDGFCYWAKRKEVDA